MRRSVHYGDRVQSGGSVLVDTGSIDQWWATRWPQMVAPGVCRSGQRERSFGATFAGNLSIAAAGYHTGVAATITAGASAGTSPTVAVSGDDVSGYATITVGTSPAAGVL